MAELILTEAEQKAAAWAELDDEALGKVVKASMFKLKELGDEQGKLYFMSAAIILCSAAAETNADKMTQTLENLTSSGKSLGSWKIVVSKIKVSLEG